jgi:hypothetical protein
MYREVEALRLRNQLDPKRFYRKDEGEGKGIKGLPKHFAVRFLFRTVYCCLSLIQALDRHHCRNTDTFRRSLRGEPPTRRAQEDVCRGAGR